MTAVSRFLMVYSGFLLSFFRSVLAAPPERFYTFSAVCLLIGFEHFSGLANKNRRFANTIFPTYFSDGADASNAASVLASSGDLRSCSTRASKSSDSRRLLRSPGFCRRAHRPQVGIGAGVEGVLELLGVHLAVLVQNVGIHAGDHVDLGVARVALGGLQVAVVQLSACRWCWNGGESERPLWEALPSPAASQTTSG